MLEDALFVWIASERSMGRPIRRYSIREKVLYLAQEAELTNFKGSNKWFEGFKNWFNLHYLKKLHGESGSIDEEYVKNGLSILQNSRLRHTVIEKLIFNSKIILKQSDIRDFFFT